MPPSNPIFSNALILQFGMKIGEWLLIGMASVLMLGLLVGLFTYGRPPKVPGKRAEILDEILFIGISLSHMMIDKILGKRRSSGSWLNDQEIILKLRGMHPDEFEEFVADMFTHLGYQTHRIGGAGDGGVDIEMTKSGRQYLVQCKKHITSKVTPHDVRDFFGAMGDHRINGKGFFVTTNIFTLEAERFAEGKPIDLVDNTRLLQLIHESGIFKQLDAKNPALPQGDALCPKCGAKIVVRTNRSSGEQFMGCSRYPKCLYTRPI